MGNIFEEMALQLLVEGESNRKKTEYFDDFRIAFFSRSLQERCDLEGKFIGFEMHIASRDGKPAILFSARGVKGSDGPESRREAAEVLAVSLKELFDLPEFKLDDNSNSTSIGIHHGYQLSSHSIRQTSYQFAAWGKGYLAILSP